MTFLKVVGINCRKSMKSEQVSLHDLDLNGRVKSLASLFVAVI